MGSTLFPYRRPRTDEELDREDERQRLRCNHAVSRGTMTRDSAESLHRWRKEHREWYKEQDRLCIASLTASYESDSDDGAPLTPPLSPKALPAGLDLSRRRWMLDRDLMKVRHIEGPTFDDYEIWKRYQRSHDRPSSPTTRDGGQSREDATKPLSQCHSVPVRETHGIGRLRCRGHLRSSPHSIQQKRLVQSSTHLRPSTNIINMTGLLVHTREPTCQHSTNLVGMAELPKWHRDRRKLSTIRTFQSQRNEGSGHA